MPQKHVNATSPSRDAPVLTTVAMAATANSNASWLPGWTNTVSVINKPVQCRAVVCRQRKMSGVLSSAAAIGLSSSVYYERMHRRRSSAISQVSTASAGRQIHASGNELQKIASVSSTSSTPQLNADNQHASSTTNLSGAAGLESVESDAMVVRTRRAATSYNKWLVAPNSSSVVGSEPEAACELQLQPNGSGSGSDEPAVSADADRREQALLLPTASDVEPSRSRSRSFDRKSVSAQNTRSFSKDEPEYVAVVIKTDAEVQSERRRVRTILRQQSAEVSGYKFAYKLSRRDTLLNKRRVLSGCSLWLALFGLVMIVVENELMVRELEFVWTSKADPLNCRSGTNPNLTELYIEAILAYKGDWSSQMLKMLTSISTFCLLVGVVADRVVLLEMFKVNNSIAEWHLALSPRWFCKLCFELLVCAIHPLPVWSGDVIIKWNVIATHKNPETFRFTPLDVFLTLPMLLRLYLIFRVIVAYSRHTAKASSHSISALNRINVDAKFILKTTAIVYPGTLLLGFIAVFWLTASWCMRLCECFHDAEFLDFANSAWLTAVTFFSIGYGDIVPTTGCGRSVAILTGLTGAGCIAFVVAVLARKIELSKAELYMHNFLRDMRITNALKNTAANVLRETWLIHKYSNPEKPRIARVRFHERKFFHAIQKMRRIKVQQRELMDSATAMIDITPLHTQLTDVIDGVQDDQLQIYDKLGALEQKFVQMCGVLESLPTALNRNPNNPNLTSYANNSQYSTRLTQPATLYTNGD